MPPPRTSFESPPAIASIAAAIFLLAIWALSFSHSCRSDGCIGIVIPAGAAAALLALQLLVVVPLFGYRRHRAGQPFAATTALWTAISISGFALPIAFVK